MTVRTVGNQKKLLSEFTIEELDRELVARGVQIPGHERFEFKDKEGTPERDQIMKQVKALYNSSASLSPVEELSHISTEELVKRIILKIQEEIPRRWGPDDRMDYFEIGDKQIKKNAGCVAAICLKDNLTGKRSGLSTLKNKNYGKTYNLCEMEPFRQQPVSAGWLCTGFLVKEDVIATAAHAADENNVKDLRIVFGFKMLDSCTPVTQVPNENIYKGVEIIRRVYSGEDMRPDWALVRLDRSVEGQTLAVLSKEELYCDQPVYVIGHPAGLPLKAAAGAYVCDIDETCFVADLDIYSGNSGSPVFDNETHEVIGIVARGENRDFRWTGKGWLSVVYPNFDIRGRGAHCTRVSQFIDFVDKL